MRTFVRDMNAPEMSGIPSFEASPPSVPSGNVTGKLRAPSGLFRMGFLGGAFVLWVLNTYLSLPTWVENILFPRPVIRMGMDLFLSAWKTVCAGWCDALYDVNTIAAIWLYIVVGCYFGLLVWILGNGYVFAKNRSQW